MSGCPTCGKDGEVKDSRHVFKGRVRRRVCPEHGRYNTLEIGADEWARLNKALKATEAERRKLKRVLPIMERLANNGT